MRTHLISILIHTNDSQDPGQLLREVAEVLEDGMCESEDGGETTRAMKLSYEDSVVLVSLGKEDLEINL